MRFHLFFLFFAISYPHLKAQNSASEFVFDFETRNTVPDWRGFGVEQELEENPIKDNVNESLLVGRVNKKKGETWDWAGIVFELPYNLDLSKNKKITMKVLATTKKGFVNFRLESSSKGYPSADLLREIKGQNAWEQLVFDFKDVNTSYQYDRLTIFIDYGSIESHIYYIDDIRLGAD